MPYGMANKEPNIRKPYRIRQYYVPYNTFMDLMDATMDSSKIVRHEMPSDARILSVMHAENAASLIVRVESVEFEENEGDCFMLETLPCPWFIESLA